jgi:hypothetical protein
MSKNENKILSKPGDHVRQGDVLLERVRKAPAKTKPIEKDGGRVILAYGEVTGHAHAFARSAKASLMVDETDRRFLLIGGGGAVLQHEEHARIAVPAGDYLVKRQLEYSPEAIRTVAD